MEKIRYTLCMVAMFALAMFATGCSEDDGYNADTAVSYYTPDSYSKMVETITTVVTDDAGKEYVWIYEFLYDAKNRIKQINGTMKYYYSGQLCNSTSVAKYIYNKALLKVEYTKEDVYPNKPAWNMTSKGTYRGAFNANGTLANFDTFDCEYNGLLFKKVYQDGGREFALDYDRFNNLVRTYQVEGIEPAEGTIKEYIYSPYANNTNFDFASFFGYNIAERLIPSNASTNYAIFQLGAFGMFGSRSTHLPEGTWEFDSDGCPTKYTLNAATSRTTNIRYKK